LREMWESFLILYKKSNKNLCNVWYYILFCPEIGKKFFHNYMKSSSTGVDKKGIKIYWGFHKKQLIIQ
jgi:hypothetical protein